MSLPGCSRGACADSRSVRVVGYHPLPNGRATARRRAVSSECSRHCASLGTLPRMPAPVRVVRYLFVRMLAPLRVVGWHTSWCCSQRHTPLVLASSRFDDGTLPWCSHKSSSARRGLQHTASRRRRSAKNGRSLSLSPVSLVTTRLMMKMPVSCYHAADEDARVPCYHAADDEDARVPCYHAAVVSAPRCLGTPLARARTWAAART